MKTILVQVTSLDGKITKGSDGSDRTWISKQDQQYFSSLIKNHNLIVMGSRTYGAMKQFIELSPDRLRVVMTRRPNSYKREAVPGQLEFSPQNPSKLLADLELRGFRTLLLVGGGTINALFFQENLVDELWLTLEPRLLGSGTNLVSSEPLDVSMRLMSVTRANRQGTLFLKYTVLG